MTDVHSKGSFCSASELYPHFLKSSIVYLITLQQIKIASENGKTRVKMVKRELKWQNASENDKTRVKMAKRKHTLGYENSFPWRIAYIFFSIYVQNAHVTYLLIDATYLLIRKLTYHLLPIISCKPFKTKVLNSKVTHQCKMSNHTLVESKTVHCWLQSCLCEKS